MDQAMIWPMPFIVPFRVKLSSMTKDEKSCMPSVNAEKAAICAARSRLSSATSLKKSCLAAMASYCRNSL